MVGQRELARAFAEAGTWLYPCPFPEISCITAMKAQAMGCWPVTSGTAALAETCGKHERGLKWEGEAILHDDAWQARYIKMAIMSLNANSPKAREKLATWARKEYSWKKVAKAWHQLFSKQSEPDKKRVIVAQRVN